MPIKNSAQGKMLDYSWRIVPEDEITKKEVLLRLSNIVEGPHKEYKLYHAVYKESATPAYNIPALLAFHFMQQRKKSIYEFQIFSRVSNMVPWSIYCEKSGIQAEMLKKNFNGIVVPSERKLVRKPRIDKSNNSGATYA